MSRSDTFWYRVGPWPNIRHKLGGPEQLCRTEKPKTWMGTCKVGGKKEGEGREVDGEWEIVSGRHGDVSRCRWHFCQIVGLCHDDPVFWGYALALAGLLA